MNAAEMREFARRSRQEAADPDNDHRAVSLRENAAEWDRLARQLDERGRL